MSMVNPTTSMPQLWYYVFVRERKKIKMKMVINGTYGGWRLPKDYAAVKLDGWRYDRSEEIRTDPDLIDIVESDDYNGDLTVVEFSDKATDYYIDEYDGAEQVFYVVDGKIHIVC